MNYNLQLQYSANGHLLRRRCRLPRTRVPEHWTAWVHQSYTLTDGVGGIVFTDTAQFMIRRFPLTGVGANSTYHIFDNINITWTEATAGNDFATWVGGFGVTDTTFGGDDDADKLGNGIEAFFGTNPSISSTGIAQVSKSGNTVTFTHPDPDAIDVVTDVTGSYEWSPDLVTWYQDNGVEGPGATTVTTVATADSPVANTTTVVATIGGTVPEKLFLRAVATQN